MSKPFAKTLCVVSVLFIFVASVLAQAAPAAAVNWTSIGPRNAGGWGGKTNAFAYVQSNPKIMYLGGGWGNTPRESPSQMGIYSTVNGGAKWKAANTGLKNSDGTISSVVNGLWLDQNNPSVVLAATEFGGTFKSTNAGKTWQNVDPAESTRFALVGTVLYLASSKGVLQSVDDGSTWTVSLSLANGATTVVSAAGATFAGSTDGDVYQLSGSSWTKLGHPGKGPIHDIALDPFNVKVLYAAVDDSNAWNQCPYASVDGGKTWKAVNCNLFSIGSQALVFSQVTPHRLFAGDDGSGCILYFTGDGNANPSIKCGASFNGADVRNIIVAPGTNDDACYILQDQGLYYAPTCSSGRASLLSSSVNNLLVYDVAASPDGKNVEAPLQDNSSTSSQDGGKTWPVSGPAGEGAETRYHPDNSGYCYIAHPDEGLFVSKDGCKTWSYNGSSGFESVTFDPSDAKHLYAVTGETSGNPIVSQSTDKGPTWKATGWKFTNPYQVAVAPSDAKSIVVATGTSSTPSSLYYSHDAGKTWTQSTGLPTTQPQGPQSIYFPTHRFYAAFDSIDATTVLLADHDPQTDNILVFRSTDGAQSFTLVTTFTQPVGQRHWPQLLRPQSEQNPHLDSFYYATRFYGNRVVFNSQPKTGNPDVVVTTRFGAFLSTDLGTTWTRIDTSAVPHHFIGATWAGGYLYLATFGEGVIRTKKPLQP